MPSQQGPNTGQTVNPAGRGGGAGSSIPATHKLIRVGGQAYEVPVETTDEEIKAVLGSPPDLHEGQTARRPGSSGSTMMDLITDIPSMALGAGALKNLVAQPIKAMANFGVRKAVPGATTHQADILLRRGAAPLVKRSLGKIQGDDFRTTRNLLENAMEGRMGGPVSAADVALGGLGYAVPGSLPLAIAKFAARPLPLSILSQGAHSGAQTIGAATGAGVGAVGQNLAQEALQRLLNGRQ